MAKGDTLYSAASRAKAMFDRNIDTLVAAFLIRHPDVLPGDIELVMRMGEDRSLNIQIERKGGIQFPDELAVPDIPDGADAGDSYQQGVAHGWNKAIQAFRDINPPFQGQEMRNEPVGFEASNDDAIDVESRIVEAAGG